MAKIPERGSQHAQPAAPAHTPAKPRPRHRVGDKVKYLGLAGEVTEVCEHAPAWFRDGHEQLYSVRVPAPAGSDHNFDTHGCVPESEIG